MLPSPRTMKYFEALAREGDKFDYEAWLKRVRQEEAAERGEPTGALWIDPRSNKPSNAVRERKAIERVPPHAVGSPARDRSRVSNGIMKNAQSARDESLKAQLFKICDVWDQILEERCRDSIYRYLKSVYVLVTRCQNQGRATDLRRQAIKIADLSCEQDAELFATVIRSTCDRKLDNKAISKFSRALRYAAHRERPPRLLVPFMKRLGGINACASLFAKILGRKAKTKS